MWLRKMESREKTLQTSREEMAGRSHAGNKENTLRRKNKIKKIDISLPKDFVHVSTVKPRRKDEVDFSDPVVQNFLQRADVNVNELSNPEILLVVKKFIERVGLDAIKKESQSYMTSPTHAETELQTLSDKCKSFTVTDSKQDSDDSSHISADDKSLIFSPDHDIEITPEMDDVFSTQSDSRLSAISCENDEEKIDSPKTRRSNTSEEEAKVNHATFLNELQGAIRKREIRMKLKRQAEQKYGDEIWSGLKSSAKSKRRVSFFEPERSPSPKQLRTVHTRWDLTDESSETDSSVLKDTEGCCANDIDGIGQGHVFDDCDENSKIEYCEKTSAKPKIPLSLGTEALNKVFLTELGTSDVDNKTVPESVIDCGTSDNGYQQKDDSPLKPKGEDTSNQFQSPASEVTHAKAEESLIRTEENNEIKVEKIEKTITKENTTPGKRRVMQWFSRKRNYETCKEINSSSATSEGSEANVENQTKENNLINSPKTNETKKGRRDKKNKLISPTPEDGKVEGEEKELKSISLKDITNLKTPTKKENKRNHSVFSSFMGKKKNSDENETKGHLPEVSENCTNVTDSEGNQEEAKICASSNELKPPTKESKEARRRLAVKKKDIKVEMFCIEMPSLKQRRNSYSMALDHNDYIFEKQQIKTHERRSFSLSTATGVFSKGENKRVSLRRPKSDLPKYEHGTSL